MIDAINISAHSEGLFLIYLEILNKFARMGIVIIEINVVVKRILDAIF